MTSSGDSPSVLLQRAAELLERRAADATGGSWRASGYEVYSDASERPIVELGWEEGGFARQEDAAWAALANPLWAAPLANILRYEARTNGSAHRGDLIALARLVLGASAEGKEQQK